MWSSYHTESLIRGIQSINLNIISRQINHLFILYTTGFHADNDANDLRNDVAFKLTLDKNTLASRSKISRVNTQLDKENVE